MNFREPREPKPSIPSVADIRGIYESQRHANVLRGSGQMLREGLPIAGIDDNGQLCRETLDNILIVGDVALGITRTNMDGEVESVRISVLPIGEVAGNALTNQSSSTIAKIDMAKLRKPRDNGVMQDWEEITIGRGSLLDSAGVRDETISRAHAKIVVKANGRVDVEDMSSNGTVVMSAIDLIQEEGLGGFPDTMKNRIAQFIQPLEQNHYLWQEGYANTRVIDPQG